MTAEIARIRENVNSNNRGQNDLVNTDRGGNNLKLGANTLNYVLNSKINYFQLFLSNFQSSA
jgi:hypothetical protein